MARRRGTHRIALLTAAVALAATLTAAGTANAASPAIGSYRWSALPHAPIGGRDDAAGVWTGHELIVWGGSGPRGRASATGAAYDPATRTWAKLAQSPLAARSGAAYVWTGTELFVWGGTAGATRFGDGALYDPATNAWTKLPAAPVGRYADAQAFLVGSQVVLVTTAPGQSSRSIRAVAFDPSTDTWATLPSRRLSKRHATYGFTAVAGGGRLYVQSAWTYSVKRGNGATIHSGVDGFTLNPTSGIWTANKVAPPAGMISYQALWTGTRVLLPALDFWCGVCPHPLLFGRTGLAINPSTGVHRKIAHGPVDDLDATYVWSDRLMFGVDTEVESSGPDGNHRPGEAAAWSPSTGKWRKLPRAPYYGDDGAIVVSTGTGVLIWGLLHGKHTGVTGVELSRS